MRLFTWSWCMFFSGFILRAALGWLIIYGKRLKSYSPGQKTMAIVISVTFSIIAVYFFSRDLFPLPNFSGVVGTISLIFGMVCGLSLTCFDKFGLTPLRALVITFCILNQVCLANAI